MGLEIADTAPSAATSPVGAPAVSWLARRAPIVAPLLLAVVGCVGSTLVFSGVLVNGDALFALNWGRDLAHGGIGSFASGPTPHPLPTLVAALTSLLSPPQNLEVTYLLYGPAAFGALLAIVYDIARRLSTGWAGAVAASVLATSFQLLAPVAVARHDVLFTVLVLVAVDLEIARPRRGTGPIAALSVAGLIRPEAWVLAGLCYVRAAPTRTWTWRILAALAVSSPAAIWLGIDTAVMGDPMWSLHVTDTASRTLYQRYSPAENLVEAVSDLGAYVGAVPLLLMPFVAVTVRRERRQHLAVLLAVLAVLVGSFTAMTLHGLASSERYLYLPACIIAILAGVVAGGWSPRTRTAVMTATVASVFLAYQTFHRMDAPVRVGHTLPYLERVNDEARELVALPGVRDTLLHCQEVSASSAVMVPLVALYSSRPTSRWGADDRGLSRPDVYLAPATPKAARTWLTRRRFDDDASFEVPAAMRPAATSGAWRLFVRRSASCVAPELRR